MTKLETRTGGRKRLLHLAQQIGIPAACLAQKGVALRRRALPCFLE